MKLTKTSFDGLIKVDGFFAADNRGSFTKMFHQEDFNKVVGPFEIAEIYYSTSNKNVIRGMHFQLPPHEHNKFVYCSHGSVLDVVIDLRKNSPTYQNVFSIQISSKLNNGLFIPKGFAHGFLALEPNTTMVYHTSSVYNPSSDAGIRYDSIPFNWPIQNPVVSERDLNLDALNSFISPF